MKTPKRAFGDWGEDEASLFLSRAGYEIVERNFRTKGGEIDIIAWHVKPRHGRTLCFVEVKTRSYGVGSAERATGYEKLQRLFRAARQYCHMMKIDRDRTPIQFEQVSVYAERGETRCKLDVIIVD